MYLVARAEVDGRLGIRGMEGALRVNFHVQFEFGSEIVADHQTGDPAVRPFVDKLITDFIVHVDGAKLLREFKGQKEGLARRSNSAPHGIIGIVEEELREHRNGEAGIPGVVEAPLDPRIGLIHAELCGRGRIVHPQPGGSRK